MEPKWYNITIVYNKQKSGSKVQVENNNTIEKKGIKRKGPEEC